MITVKVMEIRRFWPIIWPFIDPFPKRHRLVHNGEFPKFEVLYYSLNMVSLTEIS